MPTDDIDHLITSIDDVEAQLGLVTTLEDSFFWEWFNPPATLNDRDRETLDHLRNRFLYHWRAGKIDEGVVNLLVVSPVLELAGFYDPPFRMSAKVPVTLISHKNKETLRGRIDFLVIHNRFWRAIIESKDTSYDISLAIPQTLAYMAATSKQDVPVYGFVTNGNHFNFLKVQRQDDSIIYALSDEFSLRSRHNTLYIVLSILRQIMQVIALTS